jgi:hypothetical protein
MAYLSSALTSRYLCAAYYSAVYRNDETQQSCVILLTMMKHCVVTDISMVTCSRTTAWSHAPFDKAASSPQQLILPTISVHLNCIIVLLCNSEMKSLSVTTHLQLIVAFRFPLPHHIFPLEDIRYPAALKQTFQGLI